MTKPNYFNATALATVAIAGLAAIAIAIEQPNEALAKDIVVESTGEYAKIDTTLLKEAMTKLRSADKAVRLQEISEIKAHADKYAPPVFYLMSNVIFNDADKADTSAKDDAAFWFYAGQLRGRFDANRCADKSARSGIGVLNMEYGGPINRYMFMQSDLDKIENLVPKVVEWDKTTPHNYDQRWLNLHGMNAMITSLDSEDQAKNNALSLPPSEWEAIAEKTRADYIAGFNDALKELKATRSAKPNTQNQKKEN